ncbi:MAG: CtsR family transcriptional regulator [Clostridia bacterium]|nr:CtsR family transcriptional regulator [Clostridia bacterium]
MNISDLVAQTIMEMLEKEGGIAELQRNELAGYIGCVPSQINYVLTSRFTPEQGYIVESRRGGGGYIKITRINMDGPTAIMHTVNGIGDSLDQATLRAMLKNLYDRGFVDQRILKLILAATSDSTYREIPVEQRDRLRSAIFKQMLINLY